MLLQGKVQVKARIPPESVNNLSLSRCSILQHLAIHHGMIRNYIGEEAFKRLYSKDFSLDF